jgi:aspartate kinase
MDEDVGFAERALGVLRRHGVSLRRMPSGVDTVSLVVKTADLTPQREQVLQALRTVCRPDDLKVTDDLALVVVVGRGMAQQRGIAAKAFGALADAGVNVRTIDQGASEISMTIGVLAVDFETAVRALHGAFFA